MNLVTEIDDAKFCEIIDRTIQRLLQFNEYSSGEAAKYVEQQTKLALNEQLKTYDFMPLVQTLANQYIRGIVEDVTREEIKKYARAVVKGMKDKGELINMERPNGEGVRLRID